MMTIKIKKNGTKYEDQVPFIKCKINDFKKRNFNVPDEEVLQYQQRLCPDEDKLKNLEYAVRGSFNDPDRIYFSVDIVKCLNQYSKIGCASNTEIQKMLDSIYFKLHTVVDRIEF